jgi:Macrocin-O-methyltransferase (TylF)
MLITNFRLKYILYKIVCGAYQLVDTGRIHPARERSLRALQRSVDYIEKAAPDALGFDTQREAIDYSLQSVALDGHYMEFGVFTGGTIRYIARQIGNKIIHGFDSFEGFPEVWSGYNLGNKTFDTQGRMPRVPQNVLLYRGLFDESVPKWLADNPGPVAFIHIDCNIYSSTKTILDMLASRLVPGSIILFDEYFNYPGWERHEFKAFQEYVSAHQVKYTYLAFARQQAAVRIDAVGTGD